MNVEIGHTSPAGTQQLGKRLLMATCGALAGVAALAGLAGWQATSHGTATRTGTQAARPAASADTSLAQPLPPLTFYLVSSPEEEESLVNVLASDVEASPWYEFVVADSDEVAPQMFAVAADEHNHPGPGERPIQVVDARPQ